LIYKIIFLLDFIFDVENRSNLSFFCSENIQSAIKFLLWNKNLSKTCQ